jgi:hypothetical protein
MSESPSAEPAARDEPTAVGLRGGLRRLGAGLIVYGAIGLAIALLGIVALVWVNGRVATLADRIGAEVAELATTIETSAQALDDAAATAGSFAGTLERTPPSIRQAGATVDRVQASMLETQDRLAAVSLLGSQPLASVATRFGEMATSLDGLSARLDDIATDLEGNESSLQRNAASLAVLADRLATQAERLRGGFIEESIDDVGTILMVILALFAAWTAVPAVGALGLGVWLRREVDPD